VGNDQPNGYERLEEAAAMRLGQVARTPHRDVTLRSSSPTRGRASLKARDTVIARRRHGGRYRSLRMRLAAVRASSALFGIARL